MSRVCLRCGIYISFWKRVWRGTRDVDGEKYYDLVKLVAVTAKYDICAHFFIKNLFIYLFYIQEKSRNEVFIQFGILYVGDLFSSHARCCLPCLYSPICYNHTFGYLLLFFPFSFFPLLLCFFCFLWVFRFGLQWLGIFLA